MIVHNITVYYKKLLGLLASLLGARTLLGAPGLTTRSKDPILLLHTTLSVLVCTTFLSLPVTE